MKTPSLLVLAVILHAQIVGADQTVNYPDEMPIFSISFPDGWKVEPGDQSVSASSPDELVNMELLALDAEALDDAIDLGKESLEGELEDIKWLAEPEHAEINGMKTVLLNGNVTVDEVKMAINCAVFAPKKGGKFFMLFNIIPLEALEQHGDDISKVINSIEGK